MIKAVYGESVYFMLRAIAATCTNTIDVIECNTQVNATQISEQVKNNPVILPWCTVAYDLDPENRTFQIHGKGGQIYTHTFDMLNTMPGDLHVKIGLFAATQEEIATLEKTIISFFAEPKELTVTDFPGYNGSFITKLGINPKEETERKVFPSKADSGRQVYRTQINLIANRCVVPYLSVSQERIDGDINLQYQLIDRLYSLNVIYHFYCQFLDRADNFTADQLSYIRASINSIPAARGKIKAATHIPEAYNNMEYSKFLLAVMDSKNTSAADAVEKIRHTRNHTNTLHPAVRKQLIKDVKQALDIEQAIMEHTDTIRKLRTLRFEEVPPAPIQPEREDFTDYALQFPESHQQERERRKQTAALATEFNGFMGMRFPSPKESTLSERGEELYRNACVEYERNRKAYYETILPDYEKRKAEWEARRTECVEIIGLQLEEVQRQRLPHYEEIGFLPQIFQNLSSVSKVHQQLSTTNLPIQQILRDVDLLNARPGQIDALKMALELTAQIAEVKKQIDSVSAQSYAQRPTEPVKQDVPAPVYPAVKANAQFFTKENMAKSLFMGGPLGYYFTGHQDKIKEEEERIRNSPEYRQQCAAIDEEYRRKVALVEEQYRANLKQYHETILPLYEKGFSEWSRLHHNELASLKAELDRLEKELAAHYEVTKIVPVQYRGINALRYIHDVMSSSNYSIVQAIQNYDMAVQRQIEQQRFEEERRRADAAEYAAAAADRAEHASSDSYSYSSGGSYGGGIINSAIRRSKENQRRDREMRGEMYRQERMKKDYYNTPKCQRYGLSGKKSCAGCPIAHMCRH